MPAEHEHDHGHEDELFPRILTAELVGREERRQAGRERISLALLAVGSTVLALGLSDPRVVASGVNLAQSVTDEGWPRPFLTVWWVRALAPIFGAEAAAYLLSGIAFGASLPLFLRLARAAGAPRGIALTCALTALLAPLAVLGGTTAGTSAPGMFGAALLLCVLLAPRRGFGPYALRAALAWILAAGLDVSNEWMAPAVLLAAGGGRLARSGWFALLALALFAAVFLWGAAPRGVGLAALSLLGALGIGVVGLWSLGLGQREPEESRPPGWIFAIGLLAFAQSCGDLGPAGHTPLLPLAALGLGDLAARARHADRARKIARVLLACQVAWMLVACLWLRHSDAPSGRWRALARTQLEPGDAVVTGGRERVYVLRHRLELEAWDAGAPEADPDAIFAEVRRASDAGSRIVVDEASGVPEGLRARLKGELGARSLMP